MFWFHIFFVLIVLITNVVSINSERMNVDRKSERASVFEKKSLPHFLDATIEGPQLQGPFL
jgi:hypothetical protein